MSRTIYNTYLLKYTYLRKDELKAGGKNKILFIKKKKNCG